MSGYLIINMMANAKFYSDFGNLSTFLLKRNSCCFEFEMLYVSKIKIMYDTKTVNVINFNDNFGIFLRKMALFAKSGND